MDFLASSGERVKTAVRLCTSVNFEPCWGRERFRILTATVPVVYKLRPGGWEVLAAPPKYQVFFSAPMTNNMTQDNTGVHKVTTLERHDKFNA